MPAPEAKSPLEAELRSVIASKAKPMGSLGRLEDLAVQIGIVTNSTAPDLGAQRLVVFAGDHGIVDEKITAYPADVTARIAELILAGKAGASVCAAATNTTVVVVDAGTVAGVPAQPGLVSQRIGQGTRNALRQAAMTPEEYQAAFDAGQAVVADLIGQNVGIFALGEVGIGNSGAAALLAHAATDVPLATLVGPGAGAPAKGLDHKRQVLADTYARAFGDTIDCDPRRAFIEFAGFEMVMMAGAIAAIAEARRIAIIDGFIGTAVAAGLFAIMPKAKEVCVFSHLSGEPGHKALLTKLGVTPLFDMGLRLGEGTGAVMAIPFVRAAERLLTDMAEIPASAVAAHRSA